MEVLTFNVDMDRRNLVSDVQNFKLDFSGSKYGWLQVRQYEEQMRQVKVNIIHGDGTPFDITGCNPVLEGLMPDGVHRIVDAKHGVMLDPVNGQFRFDFPARAFAVAGSYKQIFFRLYKDGNNVATLEFSMEVLADKVISGLVPADYITPFEDLYGQLEDIVKNGKGDLDAALKEWTDKLSALFTTLNNQGTETATMLTTLETKIKADGLLTQSDVDGITKQFQDTYDEFKSDVEKSVALFNDEQPAIAKLISNETDFDFTKLDSSFLTSVEPVNNTPFQGFAIEQNTKEIYAGQATSEGDGYKTWILSRHTMAGKLLDSMTVANGGHGVSFGLEYINGAVYVWSNYRDYADDGSVKAQHLARFKYAPGTILSKANCELFDSLPTDYPMPYVDQANNMLLVRQQATKTATGYQNELFTLYDLAKVNAGTSTPSYTLTVKQADFEKYGDKYTLQGYCSDGTTVYVYSGYLNQTMRIIAYNASTGDQIGMRVVDFGHIDGLSGYLDDKIEAEGLAMYVDQNSGQKGLLVGLAPGRNNVNKRSEIYAIGQRDFAEVVQSQRLGIDIYSMTGVGGLAKTLAAGVTKLSDVTEPGFYYIDKDTVASYSDFPTDVGTAGWFLTISAKKVGQTVMQTLTRNSPDKMMIIQRMVQTDQNVIGDWAYLANEGTWITVPLADGYKLYTDFGLQYRRIGYKKVEMRLQAAKDDGSAFGKDPSAETIATLPTSITPAAGYNFVGTATGGRTCRVNIGTKGNITVVTQQDGVSWLSWVGSYYLD